MTPSSWWGKTIFRLLQLLFLVVILFPILYAVFVSFMPLSQIYQQPPQIFPKSLDLEYYSKALRTAPLFRYVFNSLLVSVCVVGGQLILSSFAAFSFSHFQFKGKQFLFMLILATMMIPGESIVISNYMTMGDLGLYDTYLALLLPSLASAMSIFFMRQTFLQAPKALYEVARMEGCGNLRYLFSILLPISKGSLGAIGIYTFISSWNAYMWPLLVTNKTEMRTVQVGISMLTHPDSTEYNMVMAGIVIILVPSIAIFIIGQKQILSGVLAGSVKG